MKGKLNPEEGTKKGGESAESDVGTSGFEGGKGGDPEVSLSGGGKYCH